MDNVRERRSTKETTGFMEGLHEKHALKKALENAQRTINDQRAQLDLVIDDNRKIRDHFGMPANWLPSTEGGATATPEVPATPGVGSIDADGLSYLCNGSFSTPCTVEKVAKAMVVRGMFGTLADAEISFGMVIAEDVSVKSLSQIVRLLAPRQYEELATALYLTEFNPLFLPGHWHSDGREYHFRTMPPINGTFLVMVRNSSLVHEDGTEDTEKFGRLLEFIDQHSSTKGDGPKCLQTDYCIFFPIIADSIVARLGSTKHISGLKLEHTQPFGHWDGTELAEACMATWNYYYPGVDVGGVKPASNRVNFPRLVEEAVGDN